MDPVRRFLELVQRPFPRPEQPRTRVVMAVGTGIFVAVFLLFFRPFGLHEVDASKMAVVAGFGAVTTACMLVMYFVVPRLFPSWYREEAWIVGREIMDVLMTIVLIGVGNTFYSAWADHGTGPVDVSGHHGSRGRLPIHVHRPAAGLPLPGAVRGRGSDR
jgi:hypothetical protein